MLENTRNSNDILFRKSNLNTCFVAWFLQHQTDVYETIIFKKDIALDIDVYPKSFTFQGGNKENNPEIWVKIFSDLQNHSMLSSKYTNFEEIFKKFTKNSLKKNLTSKLGNTIEAHQSRNALDKLPQK